MIPAQHRERLAKCHPELVKRVHALINEMELLNHPMMVLKEGGFRTAAKQAELYAKGRTAPGDIVTNCDGVRKRSKHQSGRAADCGFRGAHPYIGPWALYGEVAKKHGLKWSGRFEQCHVELPPGVK